MKGGGDRPGKQVAWINQVVEGSLLHDLAYFWPEILMVSLILKRKKNLRCHPQAKNLPLYWFFKTLESRYD